MCDTMGFIAEGKAFFAKNSDRSPNEPQAVEYHAAKMHDTAMCLATYIEIPQVKQTHAMLLSRPTWMWGGEMGVNDCGVCIGNEAVFTKGPYAKTGLTGMDLLRLGLERGESAKAALTVMIELLERYGQGGNSGYDHSFYYDNAFLILDAHELYVLETAGREWVFRKSERTSISNRLSIGTDGMEYSGGGRRDFAKIHLEPLYSHFSGSRLRRMQTACAVETAVNVPDLFAALRTHAPNVANPLAEGSVHSPCMHAGGLVGDHSTSSMVVELGDIPRVWLTGSSTPCISLFKPYAFGNAPVPPVFQAGDPTAEQYWRTRERFHRSVIGCRLPGEYFVGQGALEADWLTAAAHADAAGLHEISLRACQEEAAFYEKWQSRLPKGKEGSFRFRRYWNKKNKALLAAENTNKGE